MPGIGGTKPPPALMRDASCWAGADAAGGAPAAAGAEEEEGVEVEAGAPSWVAARITSSLVTRPQSPVPRTEDEIDVLLEGDLADGGGGEGGAPGRGRRGAGCGCDGATGGGSEAGAPGAAERVAPAPASICAMTVLTGMTAPSATRSFVMRPATGEGEIAVSLVGAD